MGKKKTTKIFGAEMFYYGIPTREWSNLRNTGPSKSKTSTSRNVLKESFGVYLPNGNNVYNIYPASSWKHLGRSLST